MISISIAVIDFLVDGHDSVAVLNVSVTDFGCEFEETEQLKLRNTEAEREDAGGRRHERWQLAAFLGNIPVIVPHLAWNRNGLDDQVERHQKGQVEKGRGKMSEGDDLPQLVLEDCAA